MTKAIFLDRDGVLNFDRADFIHGPDELVMIPGAAAAVSRLCMSGWQVLVATNQSGIGRGLFALQDLQAINEKVEAAVGEYGGRIDRFYFCPHVPEDNCECRKPKPGMLFQAARDFGLDLSECFLIGDRLTDIETGLAAGVTTILVLSGVFTDFTNEVLEYPPEYVAPTLEVAVDRLLRGEIISRRNHQKAAHLPQSSY